MTHVNGEQFTVHHPRASLSTENPTIGPALEGYYGLTGEIPEPGLQRPRLVRQKSAQPPEDSKGVYRDIRIATRSCWKNAQKAAESLCVATAADDPMQKVRAADELDISLLELWKLRAGRDINWKTIINHAQGLLKQAFLEKRVEELTPEQCATIQAIVDRHLGTSTKSVADLHEVVSLIEKSGFDPYFAISADPVDDNGQDLHR